MWGGGVWGAEAGGAACIFTCGVSCDTPALYSQSASVCILMTLQPAAGLVLESYNNVKKWDMVQVVGLFTTCITVHKSGWIRDDQFRLGWNHHLYV